MKTDEFWSVELGVRMGPLVLGSPFESSLAGLRSHNIDVDSLRLDLSGRVAISEIATLLTFSSSSPQILEQIDVSDDRLRFGSLVVIGKRIHEILGIFKLSRKATLWCILEDNIESPHWKAHENKSDQDRELLARGTLWIPRLGLGLTLRDGLVETVHLCHPSNSPREGIGSWTKEQQRLSEVREIPAASLVLVKRKPITIWRLLVPAIIIAIFSLVSWLVL